MSLADAEPATQALPGASFWGGGADPGTRKVLHGPVKSWGAGTAEAYGIWGLLLAGGQNWPRARRQRTPTGSAHPETPAPISDRTERGRVGVRSRLAQPCGALQGPGWRELSGAAWKQRCRLPHVECGSRGRASVASHLEAAPAASSPAHLSEQMRGMVGQGHRVTCSPPGLAGMGYVHG